MPTQRQCRVNELLRQEISRIILQDLPHTDLGFVTVTGAEVSPDLCHAQIYVSVLGEKEKGIQTITRLQGQVGRTIRGKLAERIVLRYIPELHFQLDETARHAQHIEMLLARLAQERAADEQAASLPIQQDEETDESQS